MEWCSVIISLRVTFVETQQICDPICCEAVVLVIPFSTFHTTAE